jgi:nucleotide-binding universal stress UspA family protein
MLASRSIFVPLDGSAGSERALPYAKGLAEALHGEIVLMIAAYVSDIPGHGAWSQEMVFYPEKTCTAYLDDVRDRMSVPAAEVMAKAGYPHEAILEAAEEAHAAVIVVSTHGRSGINRWMYGSTAGNLLHKSHIPLLMVGKNVPAIQGPGAFSPKHVLLPLDGSEMAEAALPYAVELADACGAKITLIRVAPFPTEAYPLLVPQTFWPDIDEELKAGAKEYLERVRSTLERPAEIRVLQGHSSEVLLQFVEDAAVDLVVMTTHARAGIQRSVLGSTADRVLQGHAPVLLIRPDAADGGDQA